MYHYCDERQSIFLWEQLLCCKRLATIIINWNDAFECIASELQVHIVLWHLFEHECNITLILLRAAVSAVYRSSSLSFDKKWVFLIAQLLLFPASNKQFTRFHGDLNLSPGILVVVYKHKIRLCIANKWFYASFGFMSTHRGCFLNLKWCEKRIDVHF